MEQEVTTITGVGREDMVLGQSLGWARGPVAFSRDFQEAVPKVVSRWRNDPHSKSWGGQSFTAWQARGVLKS